MTRLLLSLLMLTALAPRAVALQIEEEDVSFQDPAGDPESLRLRFEEALAVSRSVDQAESVPLFTELIEILSAPGVAAGAGRDELLTRSLFRRAEAQFNLGLGEEAAADLRRALEVDPDLQVDFGEISPKLADLFRAARDRTVGQLAVSVEPLDAVLLVDGEVRRPREGTVSVVAGIHPVTVERPGYEPFQTELEVAAGKSASLEAVLERTSAVLKVVTLLPAAEVVVDGEPRGVTALAEAEPLAAPDGATPDVDPGVAPAPATPTPVAFLMVDGLLPGDHLLEVRREGFRPYRGEVEIAAIADYELAPIALVETRGTLELGAVPAAAVVAIDGRPLEAGVTEGRLSVDLPVGRHELSVDGGTIGSWTTTFDLADQESVELEVDLQPRVAILGILGGDSAAAGRLLEDLRGTLGETGRWVVDDRAAEAPAALAALGIDAARLRGESAEPVEWARAQELVDRQFTASAYVLAVLSDDLFASSADIYLWAASPGPAAAQAVRVPLGPPAELEAIRRAFAYEPAWHRPRLGGRWFRSPLDDRAVLAEVFEGGPLAAAGLQAGDRIVALEGRAPDALGELPSGSETECTVARGDVEVRGTVRPEDGPVVFAAESEGVPAALLSAWVTLGEALGRPPAWLVALNRAAVAVRLDQWETVVRVLRGVEAPLGPGLGQAMVDYWLGTALLATDPVGYLAQARSMLERAAAVDGGRLVHDDGPQVAPRARARLAALESR